VLPGAALLFGVLVGFFDLARFGPDPARASEVLETLIRVTRILLLTAVSGAITRVGHSKLNWAGGAIMLWLSNDLYDHGLPMSPVSVLPVALCIAALIAARTRRHRVATWMLWATGAVLSTMLVHARGGI
ncbi:MAG TPA: hypothetical protein VIM73_23395, partial [Polyangiaceae bacterium]